MVRKKELLDAAGILRSSAELLKAQGEERGLRIKLDIPESLPLIEADRSEMEQLFTNLISNAIKYNVKRGKVTVTARPSDHFLNIKVADTGIGIDKEDLPAYLMSSIAYPVPRLGTRPAPDWVFPS